MLDEKDKDDIFSGLLTKLMAEMGMGDAHDRFAPPETMMDPENPTGHDMSPGEGQLDDGEIPSDPEGHEGIEIEMISPKEGDDEDEEDEKPSMFSRDYFKKGM